MNKKTIIITSIIITLLITGIVFVTCSCNKQSNIPIVTPLSSNTIESTIIPSNSSESTNIVVPINSSENNNVVSPTTIINIKPNVDLNNCKEIEEACKKCK